MYLTKYLSLYPLRGRKEFLGLNALSGAIDVFEGRISSRLHPGQEISESTLPPEIFAQMKKRGYFYASRAEEETALRKLFELYTRGRKKLLQFVVCPTYNCNLRCTYCFERDIPRTKYGNLSTEDVPVIFRIIEELGANHERISVHLFGGEPLLRSTKGFVEKTLQSAAINNYSVVIVTNGINIPIYRQLLLRHRDLIRYVQVTIDGPREIHNQRRRSPNPRWDPFELSATGVQILLELGIKINLRVNLDRENIHALPQLGEVIRARGWHEHSNFVCNLAPVSDHSGDSSFAYLMPEDEITLVLSNLLEQRGDLRQLFKISTFRILNHLASVLGIEGSHASVPRLWYCEATNLESYVFGPDSYIYACSEAIANPDYAIGRFKPRFEIFEERASMWGNRNILNIEKCLNCEIATLCGGGCAYSALKINGSIYDPVCNRAKEVIANYIYASSDRIAPP